MLAYLAAQSQVGGKKTQLEASIERAGVETVPEIPLLVSFHYYGKSDINQLIERFKPFRVRMMLDSGGFSAASCGSRISLASYCTYLHKHARHFDSYANLDSIGDPVKSARNFSIMLREGLEPFPVFHVGSDFKFLDEILERRPPLLALGGMVPYTKNNGAFLKQWCGKSFARILKRAPKTLVHGFGLGVSIRLLDAFPWSSSDASSWASPFMFRSIDVFDETRGRFINVNCLKSSRDVVRNARIIERYGFRASQFFPGARYDAPAAGALSILSIFRAQAWLTERKTKKHAHSIRTKAQATAG